MPWRVVSRHGLGLWAKPRLEASAREDWGRLPIAKFSLSDEGRDTVASECAALDLARKDRIETSVSQLLNIDHRPVLLLERFDRIADQRIGYMSAMTATGCRGGEAGCRICASGGRECGRRMEVAGWPPRDKTFRDHRDGICHRCSARPPADGYRSVPLIPVRFGKDWYEERLGSRPFAGDIYGLNRCVVGVTWRKSVLDLRGRVGLV